MVIAPTAVAALNVEGKTIHSFFNFPPKHIDPDDILKPLSHSRRTSIENIKVLIIDEVSMVKPNFVDCINKVLKNVRGSNKPFGGIPVVFVGDLLQLPPVVDSEEEEKYFTHRYKTPYFYSADVFKDIDIESMELKKSRRQTEPEFIEALSHIRLNDNHQEHVDLLNIKCCQGGDVSDDSKIYLVPTKNGAKSINSEKLGKLRTKVKVYLAITTGLPPDSPAPDRLELKVGAKVIFVKSNTPEWINGDTGDVVRLFEDRVQIKKTAGNIVDVSRAVWENKPPKYNFKTKTLEEGESIGVFQQFPLALGWAITIHKAQGMTLEKVVIDLGNGMFCAGQIYVALSRCRTMNGITLARPISMTDVKVDQKIIDFYKKL